MIVFLDTEFTNLIHPQLLSIGLVTMDDQEFYAEIDLDTEVGRAREKASSDFVRFEGVLDLWRRIPGATCPLNEMGFRLGRWLMSLSSLNSEEASAPLLIAFDYSTDYELMEISLRGAGVWDGLRRQLSPLNVCRDTGTRTGQQAAEAYYTSSAGDGLGRHHALTDARALREAYLASKMAQPRQEGTAALVHAKNVFAPCASEPTCSSRRPPTRRFQQHLLTMLRSETWRSMPALA